jgi:2-polyprenyl-6-hydroxyphenyl methylase/3-demethylubiquinone-9 3-methyltransferase
MKRQKGVASNVSNRQRLLAKSDLKNPRRTFRFTLPAAAAPQQAPCKICGTPAPFFGAIDFNKACIDPAGGKLPTYGQAVYYRRCPACQFLFTDYFDDWSSGEFKTHIYNEDYVQVDPDYIDTRAEANACLIAQLFAAQKSSLSVLDYGGGNGHFAECMRTAGFTVCDTYDPFSPKFDKPPKRKYDLVTSFETFEHTSEPIGTVRAITNCLNDTGGVVMFSTLVQQADFDKVGLSWWYVGPRNGHISIHSRLSLALLWQSQGYTFASLSDNLHYACRGDSAGLAIIGPSV